MNLNISFITVSNVLLNKQYSYCYHGHCHGVCCLSLYFFNLIDQSSPSVILRRRLTEGRS